MTAPQGQPTSEAELGVEAALAALEQAKQGGDPESVEMAEVVLREAVKRLHGGER